MFEMSQCVVERNRICPFHYHHRCFYNWSPVRTRTPKGLPNLGCLDHNMLKEDEKARWLGWCGSGTNLKYVKPGYSCIPYFL